MADYIYIRDLIEELRELEDADTDGPDGLEDYEKDRLEALKELDAEIDFDTFEDNYSDGLIPESEFKDHAQEFAYDIGMVDRDSAIDMYVDWDRWAEDLEMDYSTVEFEGETYYYR